MASAIILRKEINAIMILYAGIINYSRLQKEKDPKSGRINISNLILFLNELADRW